MDRLIYFDAMIRLADKVFFLRGARNGAIYDLVRGRVFAVNESACDIVSKAARGDELSSSDIAYIRQLASAKLVDDRSQITEMEEGCLSIPKEHYSFDLVWLEVTQCCNLKCIHCYEGCRHVSSPRKLSKRQWFEIIDQIAELGSENVVVIGGEPSCSRITPEIIEYLAQKKLRTTVITNGVAIGRRLRRAIVSNKVKVRISIYGHCAEVHDRVTGVSGSFQKTMDSVAYFLSHNVRVDANVVLMRENEQHLHEIEEHLKSIGVTGYKFDVIRSVFAGTQSAHSPETEEVLRLGRLSRPRFKISEKQFLNAMHRHPCWNRKVSVGEDGKVMPCVFARNIIVGDLRKQRLCDICNSKELMSCWGLKMDDVSVCSDCEFRYACRDCRPLAISVRNCRTDKMPKCDYNPVSGVWGNGD